MPQSIPESKVEEVRHATDILDLVSGYVTLKKKGQNHFGLCPFHNEKTPSFSVNSDKQIFHCFGCGAGGNAFTFLMRHEGVGFPESVKMLAQRANIALAWDEVDESQAKQNEALFHVSEFAAKWFQEMLFSEIGVKALNYLKKRGLTKTEIERFGLGYARPGWHSLIEHAEATANDVGKLIEAGLVLEKEAGKRYDRFRDRIIFPVMNLSGRVIAFGGRVMKDEPNVPKYLNSPETPIYEKSKVLYGLYQNRDHIRRIDKAIFVEGYMDLLSLQVHEIHHVVATSGTALTQQQAGLIGRYTKNVVLMYDSDLAGSAATLRGADVLIENGLEVYIAALPEGHDPDTFVRDVGKEALLQHVDEASNLFDRKLNSALLMPPGERRDAVQSFLESVAKVKDRIQRSLLVSKASENLKISENDLWSELQRFLQRQQGDSRTDPRAEQLRSLTRPARRSKSEKAAEELVKILLYDWTLAEMIFGQLKLNFLTEHELYPVLEYLGNQFKGGVQPTENKILHHFNDIHLTEFIVKGLHQEWEKVDLAKWASDCIVTVNREKIQLEIDRIREEIKQNAHDNEMQKTLLARCMELEAEKKILAMNSPVARE